MNKEYFDNFPNKMKKKLDAIDDDLAQSAPLLAAMDKRSFYTIPDNYFQENEKKLRNIAISSKVPKTRKRSMYYAGFAACFLALCFSFWYASPFATMDDFETESIEDTQLMLAHLDNVDLDFLLSIEEDSEDDLYLNDLTDDDVEEYLDYLFEDFTELELINTF